MSQTVIDWSELEAEIHSIMQGIPHDVENEIDKASKEVAEEAVDKLKATSPVRQSAGGTPGAYARAWTYRRNSAKRCTVYNKQYQLTHLLERGHVHYSHGIPTGTEAEAYVHIKPVEEWVQDEFEDRLKVGISEGLGKD